MEKVFIKMMIGVLEPIVNIGKSESPLLSAKLFLGYCGISIINSENLAQKIVELAQEMISSYEKLNTLIESNNLDLGSLLDLIEKVQNIYYNIYQIKHWEEETNIPGLYKKIIDTLLTDYFKTRYPKIFSGFTLIKVFENKFNEELKTSYFLVNVEPLFELLKSPPKWFASSYNWGESEFLTGDLFRNLSLFLDSLNILTFYEANDYKDLMPQNQSSDHSLKIPLVSFLKNNKKNSSGIKIYEYKERGSGISGLGFSPYGLLNIESSLKFSNNWKAIFNTTIDLDKPMSFLSFPNKTEIISSNTESAFNSKIWADFILKRTKIEPDERKGNHILSYSSIGFGLNSYFFNNQINYGIKIFLQGARLNFSVDQFDSLVQEIVPQKIDITFDFELNWSTFEGFYLNTSSSLETHIPINKKTKALNLNQVFLGLYTQNDKVLLAKIGINFDAVMGPFFIKAEKLSVTLETDFNNDQERPFRIKGPKIQNPEDIGVSVKSSIIKGGGFLLNDQKLGQYSGILSLQFQKIELTAIGLITIKLPNNQKGFSMLAAINVLFAPSIPIGFGFNLKGVGGIIGIHRTLKIDALRERFASGAINSIMFPENPIENANKIISDLRSIFPPKKDHYIIAPFLRLGWGSGKSIELDLGVLIELPFKNRVIILGSLGIYIPNKKKIISEIHVDVLGDFNFAEKYIRIEGILRNSHIKNIPLQGGFAFVLGWGSQPQFLFSVGGYHPAYKKPKSFPEIPRLSAVLKKGKWTITMEYYTAITSNTFQLGYRADFEFKKKRTKAVGYFSFDTLIQFDPFYFIAEIGMGIDIKHRRWRFAAQLHFMLSGPKPWRVKGYGRFRICGFKVKIKFDKTWGGKKQDELPPSYIETIDLLKKVEQELCLPASWSANLPQNFSTLDTLRSLEESEEQLLIVHPSGYLEVRQQAIPLKTIMERNGEELTREKIKVELIAVSLNGTTLEGANDTKEYFAITQFHTLNDAEKIDAKDFELFPAGKAFNGVEEFAFHGSDMAEKKFGYDEPIYPKAGEPEAQARPTSRSVSAPGGISIDPVNWRKSKRKMRRRIRKNNDAYRFKVLDDMPNKKKEYYAVMERTQLVDPGQMIEIIALGGFNNRYSAYETRAEALIELKSKKEGLEKWQITTIDEELFKLYSKVGLPV